MPKFKKNPTPFMMRSGNSPMFKMMGSSPLQQEGKIKQKTGKKSIINVGDDSEFQKVEINQPEEKKEVKKVETGIDKPVEPPKKETLKETEKKPTPPKKDKPVTPPKKDKPKPPPKKKPTKPGDPPPQKEDKPKEIIFGDPTQWWRGQ